MQGPAAFSTFSSAGAQASAMGISLPYGAVGIFPRKT